MLSEEELARLLDALGQNETFKRLEAQNTLTDLGSIVVEPLINLVQNGTLKQVASAITVLATIRDPRTIEPLIGLLHAPQSLLRMSAAKALAEFEEQSVVEALLGSLSDPNEMVQIWAIHSLGVQGDRCAVEPLLVLLDTHRSSDVRYMIIRALGEIGDPDVIPHLVRFLNDDNRHVQRDAKHALVKLGYLDATEDVE